MLKYVNVMASEANINITPGYITITERISQV